MKASDISFEQIMSEYPEQYYAIANNKKVGYVRVKRDFCEAWCPDEGSDDEVYSKRLEYGWWSFGNENERSDSLAAIKERIAEWWNKTNG